MAKVSNFASTNGRCPDVISCEACGYEIDPADEEPARCYECGATIHSDCRKKRVNYHGCGKCT